MILDNHRLLRKTCSMVFVLNILDNPTNYYFRKPPVFIIIYYFVYDLIFNLMFSNVRNERL